MTIPRAIARRMPAPSAALSARDATPVTAALLRKWPLPALDDRLGKVARGRFLVIGGSSQIPGAVLLAAIAALRAGAGTAMVATSRTIAMHLALHLPEARVIPMPVSPRGELAPSAAKRLAKDIAASDAILVGPGMRAPASAAALFATIANETTAPVVADAGALAALPPRGARPRQLVLTPHAGELAALIGIRESDVMAAPVQRAHEAAQRFGAVVVAKGAATYITSANGELFCNTAGNLGLGTSGSGDTLSGIITGLLARGATPMQAAVWGVHVHAKCGDALAKRIAPLGYLAREILDEVPGVLAGMTRR